MSRLPEARGRSPTGGGHQSGARRQDMALGNFNGTIYILRLDPFTRSEKPGASCLGVANPSPISSANAAVTETAEQVGLVIDGDVGLAPSVAAVLGNAQ